MIEMVFTLQNILLILSFRMKMFSFSVIYITKYSINTFARNTRENWDSLFTLQNILLILLESNNNKAWLGYLHYKIFY